MDKQESNISGRGSFERKVFIVAIIFLFLTTILFGYLYYSEILKDKGLSQELINREFSNGDSIGDDIDECGNKHVGDYSWISYLSYEGKNLYYNEVRKKDNLVCNHKIFSTTGSNLIQVPHLHEERKKVSFFLQEVSEDFKHSSEVEYYIVDLNDDSVNKTGIMLPYSVNTTINHSEGALDEYIISYPGMAGGCGTDEECWEKDIEDFDNLWKSSKIFILNVEGDKYEIEGRDLPSSVGFLFTTSSSPNLIAIEYGINTEIERIYELSELFKE